MKLVYLYSVAVLIFLFPPLNSSPTPLPLIFFSHSSILITPLAIYAAIVASISQSHVSKRDETFLKRGSNKECKQREGQLILVYND